MPDLVQTEEFNESLLPLLRSFRFWEGETGRDFERELAEWLDTEILPAVSNGTRVWLYRNAAGEAIGYGSLGRDVWVSRTGTTKPLIIPAVAIRHEFQGKPAGPAEKRLRYSHQILADLIAKGEKWIVADGLEPFLGLLTHPDNTKAVNLYRQFGFEPFDYTFVDPLTKIEYPSYVYDTR